jgi:hypothetical protein
MGQLPSAYAALGHIGPVARKAPNWSLAGSQSRQGGVNWRSGLLAEPLPMMQWTEMTPPCRFDIAAQTAMATWWEEGGVRARRDPSWRDTTERRMRRCYEPT